MENGGHCIDDTFNIWFRDGRTDVHRVHSRRFSHFEIVVLFGIHFFIYVFNYNLYLIFKVNYILQNEKNLSNEIKNFYLNHYKFE